VDDRTARFIERSENQYYGKYRALVADRADPEQLGRLKLQVPSVLADAVTGWAWPAAAYAGDAIGFFALPKVGDMVWAEFAEGEIDHPIWSGGSWAKPGSTSEVPQDARDAYGDRVVLQSASGNVIVLADDAGGERITIRAAQGCEVMLDPAAGRVTVQAGEVIVRGPSGVTQELATKAFVQQVYDLHTHPTGVGPSGPPVPTSLPTSITSVLKAE
jgi:uncharacterized protein involved in type VI secretion and phage assembly